MKFGIFLPNGSNGYVVSKAAPIYAPTFKHNLAITLEAERLGLAFVLSMVKFKGFGGEVKYWDANLDSLGLMAALAAATSRIEVIGTAPILALHPAMTARAIATIDDISGGRAGLNIVTGWSRHEYGPMGLWPGDDYFNRRYERADEYVAILRDLWRTGRCSRTSAFFQLDDCVCEPRPQREVPIICAGQSPRGMAFTAKHGDYNFAMANPTELKGIVERTHEAAAKAGRKVGTYAYMVVIARETDAEAEAEVQRLLEGADRTAIAAIVATAALDSNAGGVSQRLTEGLSRPPREGNLAFYGAPVIHGSHRSVAQQFEHLAATGLEGALLVFTDYVRDLASFGRNVLPLLARGPTPGHVAA